MSSTPASILIVTDTMQAGGAERVVSDMANYWANAGLSITVLTLKSVQVADFYELSERVDRRHLTAGDKPATALMKLPRNIGRLQELRRAFRSIAPDAIVSFIDVPNILTIIASLRLPSRVVVSERGCPDVAALKPAMAGNFSLGGHWQFLRRRLYRYADSVTALNTNTAEWLAGECRTDVTVIPNAIRNMPNIQTAREKTILGIGRQQRIKGFDILVDAFARIEEKHVDWSLTLIGDGPERGALQEQARSLNIASKVTFVPTQSDIESRMASAGIVVSPSRSEAFGNVILESMAMGAPIICSACAGPTSIVEDGVDGLLVPTEDADTMALAMLRLIDDPNERIRLGENARRVRETYSQDAIMEQWNALLRS